LKRNIFMIPITMNLKERKERENRRGGEFKKKTLEPTLHGIWYRGFLRWKRIRVTWKKEGIGERKKIKAHGYKDFKY